MTSQLNEPHRRMRGLERAFHIFEYLQEQKRPLRPNEIAEGIGAPKSTVYEIIKLLLEQKALESFDGDGRVFLGRKLYFLGHAYIRQFDLVRESDKYLSHLSHSTQETSQMCMLDGQKYTVVIMKEGNRHFRISSDIGHLLPIPWTASGRLLVSHMSDQEILDFIPEEDFLLPNGTKLDTNLFLTQVHHAQGESFFSADSLVDNFTHCFAAPIYEGTRCLATFCLIAPREDALSNYQRYKSLLTEKAHQLTTQLGGYKIN